MSTFEALSTPTISAAAYTANDVIGGLQSFTFNGLLKPGGILDDIIIYDSLDIKASLSLHLYDSLPTEIVDADPYAPADGDIQNKWLRSYVAVNTYQDLGGIAVVSVAEFLTRASLNVPFKGRTLWLHALTVATPTYGATTGLSFKLKVRDS